MLCKPVESIFNGVIWSAVTSPCLSCLGWESDSVLGQVVGLVTDHLLLAKYYLNMDGLQLNVGKDLILLQKSKSGRSHFLLMECDSYSLDSHCSIYNSPLCLATTTVHKSVSRLLPAINQDRVFALAAHPNLSGLLTVWLVHAWLWVCLGLCSSPWEYSLSLCLHDWEAISRVAEWSDSQLR